MSFPKRGAPKVEIVVPLHIFKMFREVIRRNGVAKDLQKILAEGKGKGGVPSKLEIEIVLTTVMCYIYIKKEVVIRHLDMVLAGLDYPVQQKLGLLDDDGKMIITEDMIQRFFNKVDHKLRWTNTKEQLTEYEIAARKKQFYLLINKIILSSFPKNLMFTGKIALDSTGVCSWANQQNVRKYEDGTTNSYDRDSGIGYRTPTSGKTDKSGYFFGSDVLTAVQVPDGKEDSPALCVGMIPLPAGMLGGKAASAIELLDIMDSFGFKTTSLTADMEFSNYMPETFAYPLRHRGIRQVVAVREDQHGPVFYEGLLMINGWPHSPQTPKELWNIKRPHLTKRTINPNDTIQKQAEDTAHNKSIDKFREDIKKLQRYAFKPHGLTKAKNPQPRYTCPAWAGLVNCDGCPVHQVEGLEKWDNPPRHRGKACQQQTITVPLELPIPNGADKRQATAIQQQNKIRQELYYGSEEWCDEFGKRSLVESGYGNLEELTGVDKGFIKTVGLVNVGLFIALAIAVQNVGNIWAWQERNPEQVADESFPRPSLKDIRVRFSISQEDFALLDKDLLANENLAPPGIAWVMAFSAK